MDIQAHRKDEHYIIAEKLYQENSLNDLNGIQLTFDSLPELGINDIDISTKLAGRSISAPFFINAMTGGSPETGKLNRRLAKVAHENDLALATGSQSVALANENAAQSFKIARETDLDGIMIANLGASHGIENALKAIKMTDAQILEIHLNPAQELVMPEGDRSFYWVKQLKEVVNKSPVPVIVKEVGMGLSPKTLTKLKKIGVQYVDIAGYGGTNFITIENQRRHRKEYSFLTDSGLSTAKSLLAAQSFKNDFSITASGGIRSALDIVKCLALGADNVGISGLFLHTLIKQGDEGLDQLVKDLKIQVAKIMLLLGCRNIAEVQNEKVLLSSKLLAYKQQL
ncbi:type 2 isopentenyl-diphosphate Delta-isomerase [Ligilactobacillus pobuzihii]|uniref:type 2 isopentenyl-diphosphate Delta-isomerase n=1 Tax=Ligilactobacillus pobuzihii TaxID=449659 RepID=UPI0019D1734A|nr:type 2 isopentenyl-diphosphate Delta-isomerase [Ligilactobacillus pobuzihii]MBN7275234.1 type 2 isopentenyl-diphosphate Delta-isomerase [Ligilactobacillus pobuzihii]